MTNRIEPIGTEKSLNESLEKLKYADISDKDKELIESFMRWLQDRNPATIDELPDEFAEFDDVWNDYAHLNVNERDEFGYPGRFYRRWEYHCAPQDGTTAKTVSIDVANDIYNVDRCYWDSDGHVNPCYGQYDLGENRIGLMIDLVA